jgi:hypothetical protein
MKVSVKYWRSSLAVVMALIMSTSVAFAQTLNPGVVPINGQVGGLTYGQWSARWWQYAYSVTTFARCRAEPSGPMWFLAGAAKRRGIAVRSCIVPSGRNIMFPVFNAEWSVAEAQAQQMVTPTQSCLIPDQPNGTSDADLLACATAQANQALDVDLGASLEADVDGVTLQNLLNFRAVSPPFTFTTVGGNPFRLCPADGSCPLTSRAVADGFWIILTPLSPGMHTIHFAATVPFPNVNPPAMPFTFTTDATYHLMVQP